MRTLCESGTLGYPRRRQTRLLRRGGIRHRGSHEVSLRLLLHRARARGVSGALPVQRLGPRRGRSAGGDMLQLTTDPTPDWQARWSPDGQDIAFYSYRSGNRDIWVMPVEGGPAKQLTTHESRESSPAWSPDGSRIVFNSERAGNRDLWVDGCRRRRASATDAPSRVRRVPALLTRRRDHRFRLGSSGGRHEHLDDTLGRRLASGSERGRRVLSHLVGRRIARVLHPARARGARNLACVRS